MAQYPFSAIEFNIERVADRLNMSRNTKISNLLPVVPLCSPNYTLYLQLWLNYRDTNDLTDVHRDLIFGQSRKWTKILSEYGCVDYLFMNPKWCLLPTSISYLVMQVICVLNSIVVCCSVEIDPDS